MKKIIFLMLLAILSCQQVGAQFFTFGGLNYNVTSATTVEVADNQLNQLATGNVIIPAQVTYNSVTYSVTAVGIDAFKNRTSLISVPIPNSVISIGNNAFDGCNGLTSVIIPNSVTSIGEFAFYGCSGLTSITIPNAIQSIGRGVFFQCGLTSVTIPNSVTSIGDSAFQSCWALTSITIPNLVTSIGDQAFLACSSLESVTIPSAVTSFGYASFANCSSLHWFNCNVTTPISINADVFRDVNTADCGLIVPLEGLSAYRAANVWKLFRTITAANSIPSTLSLCAGAKVADAVGTSELKFYPNLTSLFALAPTTVLTTRTYFVTDSYLGFETDPRIPVAVTINALPTTVAAITASDNVLCKYIGTTNTVTYTATPGASAYIWTVPAGVTIIGGQGTNVLTVDFSTATTSGASTIGNIGVQAINASGCTSAIAKTIALSTRLPTAPSKVELTYNGVVKTKVGNYVGDASKTLVLTATDTSNTAAKYTWDLPAGATVVGGNPATDKTIAIHLGGVAAGNTNLVFKVYSIGGCGASIARSLTVTRTAPAAPTALSLTNDAISSTTKITIVSAYTGKLNTTPLTLTAIPSTTAGAEATSYKWILPSGIGIVDASAVFVSENSGFKTYTSAANAIQINLSGVGTATSLLLKVYGVNGNGESLLSKNLTLTSAIPAKPGKLTNAFTSLGSTPTYHPSCGTISCQVPNVFGITFTWSIKDGAMATIFGDGVGNLQTIDVSQLPTAVNSSFRIGVVASNGTGSSETIYTIKLGGACTGVVSKAADVNTDIVANEFNVIAYPNPSSNVFNFKVNGANDETVSILVFDMMGRQVDNKVVNASDVENFALGQNYSSGVYNVVVSQGLNTKTVRLVKR